MGFLKLAAGVAVGYVLGSRAGREKYESIAATARKVGEHPTVLQAQEKAKALISTGTDKVNAKLSAAAAKTEPTTVVAEQVIAEPVIAEPTPAVTARTRAVPRPAPEYSTLSDKSL